MRTAPRAQLGELAENVTRMRSQHDDALTAHRHTTSRLENFDQDFQAATGKLEDVVRRVQSVERQMEPINQASTAIPDVQHQLAVLKALADQVAQKTTMLEQEREAVDRAATQIAQLTRMDRELDAWLRRQEEQIRRFGPIEAKITEVKTIQDKVLARTEELQATSQKIEDAQQSARQALTDLREQMRKSSEGFELEHRSLHAVSERIADLRKAVKECEARFGELDAASQGTAAVQNQVRNVGEQIADLSKEVAASPRKPSGPARCARMWAGSTRMADDLAARMRRLDEIRPGVEQAVRAARHAQGHPRDDGRRSGADAGGLRGDEPAARRPRGDPGLAGQRRRLDPEGADAGEGAQRDGAGGRADPRRSGAGQGAPWRRSSPAARWCTRCSAACSRSAA